MDNELNSFQPVTDAPVDPTALPVPAPIPAPTRRVPLTGISSEAYRHPLDRQAAAALRAVPGFELAASKFSRYGIEQYLYMEACASAVRVTPKQCGRIHALLTEACAVLDLPVPALFLAQTPVANAFALGRENPTIVLQTGLVELMTEEELMAVIAHELGHIHCGHSILRLMAIVVGRLLEIGGKLAGVDELFSLPLRAALLEWTRKAEFSADRAAILATQNPEAVFQVLFKLTGGSPKIYSQMNREEYLRQAEEYDRPDAPRLDRFYKTILESERPHPIPVLRAREAVRYGESEEYRKIIDGDYLQRDKNTGGNKHTRLLAGITVHCVHCGSTTDAAFTFCTRCGTDLPRPVLQADEVQEATTEGDAVTETPADLAINGA